MSLAWKQIDALYSLIRIVLAIESVHLIPENRDEMARQVEREPAWESGDLNKGEQQKTKRQR